MVHFHVFVAGPFVSTAVQWLVLYMGFMGAYKRNTCLLLGYFLLNLFAAIMMIIGFVMLSIGGSLLLLNRCEHTRGCNPHDEATKDVAIVTGLTFVFTLVPLVLVVIGAVLSIVTRKEIIRARRAIFEAEKMEEGFSLEQMKPVEQSQPKFVEELPAAQPQLMPVYYAPFDASQAGGMAPMGSYSPMVYYYPINGPFPAQQQ